jgi:hypothetical protein
VCSLLALAWFGSRTGENPITGPAFPIGSILKASPDLTYNSSDLTVLVGLSSTCRFCADSLPAFRQLNDAVRSRGADHVRVFAVSLDSPDVLARYLQENGLTVFRPISVSRDSPAAPVASRTPTLVLVDRSGTVLASWAGRMTVDQMAKVDRLHHITSPD